MADIQLNWRETAEKAKKVSEMVDTLRVSRKACADEVDGLRQNWEGEATSKLLAKLEEEERYLDGCIKALESTATGLKGISDSIKRSELAKGKK